MYTGHITGLVLEECYQLHDEEIGVVIHLLWRVTQHGTYTRQETKLSQNANTQLLMNSPASPQHK